LNDNRHFTGLFRSSFGRPWLPSKSYNISDRDKHLLHRAIRIAAMGAAGEPAILCELFDFGKDLLNAVRSVVQLYFSQVGSVDQYPAVRE
jgi:hypothetical protein